jgi:hypothetical protein
MTQGTYPHNEEIIKALPRDTGVEFYCGSGCPHPTYNSSRDPMIYPLLTDYVSQGGWLGVYPTISASFGPTSPPWSAPQYVQYRMSEYVDKGLKSVCAFINSNKLLNFNMTALAEWSWNAHGRTPYEFAAAWATRAGFKDPDAVAEWAVLLGPAGWDLYGSPQECDTFTSVLLRTAQGMSANMEPRLGIGLWRYFPSAQHLDENEEACRKALALAEQVQSPLLIAETRTIQGYTTMVASLYSIGTLLHGGDTGTAQVQSQLRQQLDKLRESGEEATRSTIEWQRAMTGNAEWDPSKDQILSATDQTVQTMNSVLTPFLQTGMYFRPRIY